MKKKKPFYADGIRFACTGCGGCCVAREQHTYVYLSFGDRKRLAAHLSMTTSEFTRKYTQGSDGLVHLKDPDKDCPFLQANRCVVHTARPWQCRTWPFWPENMHPKIWQRDVANFCPGVGSGRLYSAAEIDDILERRMEAGEGVELKTRGQDDVVKGCSVNRGTDLPQREKPGKR